MDKAHSQPVGAGRRPIWWQLAAYDETPVLSVSAGQPGFAWSRVAPPAAVALPGKAALISKKIALSSTTLTATS
jgi:hypothetical protein